MPPAISAVAIALAGGGFAIPTAFQFAVAKFLVGTLVSVAFNFVSGALTQKEKPSQNTFASIKSLGSSQQFRQAITERRIVYGENRVSGPIVFPRVTGNNVYLNFVIVLASHEVEEIGECIIDEESITPDMLDGSGNVTSGKYSGLIRIKKHLGDPDQTVDTDLDSEVGEWTSNHRLRNCAYVYVRYKWNRDKFPTGIPNFSAWVKGKKCYDPRDDSEKYTNNIALITRDYLTDTRLGLRTATGFVDDDTVSSAANTCEEFVQVTDLDVSFSAVNTSTDIITMNGTRLQFQTGDKVQLVSGTVGGLSTLTDYYVIVYQRKTTPRIKLAASFEDCLAGVAINLTSGSTGTLRKIAEPRYVGGGVLKTNAERGANLEEILTGMAGQCVYSGGFWKVYAGEYQTPTIYLDENDVVGSIRVSTKVSRAERFNHVQGVYISQLNDGNPADYPLVKNDSYVTQDGEILRKNLDLGFTQRPHSGQRIAKIALERMRQEIIFEAKFKLTAFKLQVGDNFYFSFTRYGWDEKVFEVINWSLSSENDAPVIVMKCRENASGVYDWNNGEETAVDPAPNTTLPDPTVVSVVTGFSLDSYPVNTKELDRVYNVIATWDLSDDQFVSSGGSYEVQFKETTETTYKSVGKVDGDVTEMILNTLKPDVLYDIRIFAYNSLGVRSAETLIEDFQAGQTVTTNTEDWENESLARDTDDWETDTLTSEDWEA